MFFKNASNGLGPGLAYQSPPGISPRSIPVSDVTFANGQGKEAIDISQLDIHDLIQDHLAVFSLIRGYQVCICFCYLFVCLPVYNTNKPGMYIFVTLTSCSCAP